MIVIKKYKDGKTYPAYRIACNLTDEDVLKRLHNYVGGLFSGPVIDGNPKHKPFWRWGINKREAVQDLCVRLLPLMGVRRSSKIREILQMMEDHPMKSWKHGTRTGYEYGCRCSRCVAYNTQRGTLNRRRRGVPLMKHAQHGTRSMYTYHRCRCEKCMQSSRDYAKIIKARSRPDLLSKNPCT